MLIYLSVVIYAIYANNCCSAALIVRQNTPMEGRWTEVFGDLLSFGKAPSSKLDCSLLYRGGCWSTNNGVIIVVSYLIMMPLVEHIITRDSISYWIPSEVHKFTLAHVCERWWRWALLSLTDIQAGQTGGQADAHKHRQTNIQAHILTYAYTDIPTYILTDR